LAAVHSALKSLDQADAAAAITSTEGLTIKNADTKVIHAHPACKIEKDCRAAFFRIWDSLGLCKFDAPKPYGR
jgi:phage terminase small subunit